jgi:hypothetical protein
MKSGDLLSSATTDAIRLIQKELPVSQGRFRILIDRHDDCLDVGVAPTFARRPVSNLGQGFHPWRVVHVVPFERFSNRERPPKALPFTGPLLFLEPVPFGAQLVDPLEHSLQERFG